MWQLIRILGIAGVLRLIIKLMLDPRVSLRSKLVLPAAIAYIISPIDLIRDFIPVLGYVDDVLVALLAIAVFLLMAPRKVVSEHLKGRRAGSASGQDRDEEEHKPPVIEGSYRFEEDDEPGPRPPPP